MLILDGLRGRLLDWFWVRVDLFYPLFKLKHVLEWVEEDSILGKGEELSAFTVLVLLGNDEDLALLIVRLNQILVRLTQHPVLLLTSVRLARISNPCLAEQARPAVPCILFSKLALEHHVLFVSVLASLEHDVVAPVIVLETPEAEAVHEVPHLRRDVDEPDVGTFAEAALAVHSINAAFAHYVVLAI